MAKATQKKAKIKELLSSHRALATVDDKEVVVKIPTNLIDKPEEGKDIDIYSDWILGMSAEQAKKDAEEIEKQRQAAADEAKKSATK